MKYHIQEQLHENIVHLNGSLSVSGALTFFFSEILFIFFVLGFNDTSTLLGHFVLSPREWEKRDRRDGR